MRTTSKSRTHFCGTHKGCDIEIEREKHREIGSFYIMVRAPDGGYLYDGWSPPDVLTMAEAKREALYGACLKPRPPAKNDADDRRREAASAPPATDTDHV